MKIPILLNRSHRYQNRPQHSGKVGGKVQDAWAVVLRVAVILLAVYVGLIPCQSQAQGLPAFPGAEGFGAVATGGRGGTVYHVTNLNNSGAGSFRDAVSGSNRIIVFDVGGQIVLSSRVTITGSNITIAGQTAPGGGIGIMGCGTFVSGDNIIIRNMRFREGKRVSGADDSLDINSSADRVILDHCSVQFGEDENLTNYGTNTTVQWTSVTHGLRSHSAGGLTEGTNHSYHHNLYAHNHTRNIKNNSGLMDFTNNIVYNYGFSFIAADSTGGTYNLNFRGNYYSRPENGSRNLIVEQGQLNSAGVPTVNLYLGRNFTDANADGIWNGYDRGRASVSGSYTYVNTPFAVPAVTLDDPAEAYNKVIAGVGASPWARDEVDAITIYEVTNQVGRQISSQNEMRTWWLPGTPVPGNDGYGTLAPGTPPADTDQDGMPNAWELRYGLNPNNANDRNGDFDGTGYTNVEKYINGLMDGSYPSTTPFPVPSEWANSDIGAVGATGSATYPATNNGAFTVRGAGADIYGTADAFHFVYKQITGDATITARVASLQNTHSTAMAGVMFRETLDAGSKHAAFVARPSGGVMFNRRTSTGGSSGTTQNTGTPLPEWVRLRREGSSFTAFRSADGVNWEELSTITIAMADTVYVGLPVSSHVVGTLTTAVFDNVSIANWQAEHTAVGAGNTSRVLLKNTVDGEVSLWTVDASGGMVKQANFGPYAGWDAVDIAVGSDNVAHVLWQASNGQFALWKVDATSNGGKAHETPIGLSSRVYGPFAGWSAVKLAVGANNQARVLWRKTNGQAGLWTVDASWQVSSSQYGSYAAWSAVDIGVGADNQTRLLWQNTNGQVALWKLDAAGGMTSRVYGPYAGWSAAAIAVGADNQTRMLWRNINGQAGLWTVAASWQVSSSQYGPYAGWSAVDIGVGADNQSRLLWQNTNGQIALWMVNAGGAISSSLYGPF